MPSNSFPYDPIRLLKICADDYLPENLLADDDYGDDAFDMGLLCTERNGLSAVTPAGITIIDQAVAAQLHLQNQQFRLLLAFWAGVDDESLSYLQQDIDAQLITIEDDYIILNPAGLDIIKAAHI